MATASITAIVLGYTLIPVARNLLPLKLPIPLPGIENMDAVNRHLMWTDPIMKFIDIGSSPGAMSESWPISLDKRIWDPAGHRIGASATDH